MDDHNNKEQNRNESKWNCPFQVYHIKSNNNCLQILAVQVEPSSSSGIDLPLDNDSPPRFVFGIAVWLMTPPVIPLYSIASSLFCSLISLVGAWSVRTPAQFVARNVFNVIKVICLAAVVPLAVYRLAKHPDWRIHRVHRFYIPGEWQPKIVACWKWFWWFSCHLSHAICPSHRPKSFDHFIIFPYSISWAIF